MGTPLRVLVLEDSNADYELLLHELRRGGYDVESKRVETAADMKAALVEKTWDIIVCDFCMPQFDAFDALKIFKKSGLDLPFIVSSGTIGEDVAVQTLKAGAHDYFMKDKLARLCPAVERELREANIRKERNQADRISREVLELLNRRENVSDLVRDILLLVKENTGIEAMGIRLHEGDDFPYYETIGFSDHFVQAERLLCARDQAGELIRDSEGNPYLECMCGNIISGRTDPSKPFFTEKGSFWSNSTTQLLAFTTEEDRQARTRNHCNGEGYESVALIPLRADDKVIGLLQLNDSRPNCFTEEMIHFFEGIGASIGIALARMKLEKSVINAAAQWRTTFDSMADHVMILDSNYRITRLNKAMAQMLNLPFSEIIGRRCFELVHGTDAPPEYCIHPFAIANGSEHSAEVFDAKANRHYSISVTPHFDDSGKQIGAVHIMRDITERKLAEEMLSESERKYKGLIDNFQDIIFTIDLTGNIIFASPSTKNVLGYTVEEALRMNILDFLPEEDRLRAIETIPKGMKGEKIINYQTHALTKSGDRVFLEITFSRIYKDGTVIGAQAIAKDITDRKRAEETLRESERKLKDAQRLGRIGHWEFDLETQRIRWSDMVFALYERDTNLGPPTEKEEAAYYSAEDAGRLRDCARKAAETGEPYELDLRVKLPGGRFMDIVAMGTPVKDASGRVIRLLGTVQDITDRKRAEDALERRNRSLMTLNAFALELSSLPYDAGIKEFLVKKLIKLPGVAAAWFTDYDPADRTLHLAHIEIEPDIQPKIVQLLGKPLDMGRYPVNEPTYKEIVGKVIGKRNTLTEVSFGMIPPPVGSAIEKLLGIDRFIGMSYVIEGNLCGTSVLAMKAGYPDPDLEMLESIAHTATVSLRRRQAEEALRESEERYRLHFEHVTDVIYSLDSEFCVTSISPSVEARLGYKPEELIGKRFTDLNILTPESIEKGINVTLRIFSGETVTETEYEFIAKDGTHLFAEISGAPIYEGEKVIGLVSVARDITERKRAEEELRESEERYATLFRSAAEGILVADMEAKRFVYANPSICRMLGYSEEEMKRLGVLDIHPPESLEYVLGEFEAQALGKRPLPVEFPCRRKDGSVFYADITASSMILNERLCNVGFFSDITDRKRAEEDIIKAKKDWEDTFNTINDAITLHDNDYNILLANRAACELFGEKMEKIVGRKCHSIYHKTDCPPTGCPSCKSLKTGKFTLSEMFEPALNKHIEIKAFPRLDNDNKITGIVHIVRDISEQKKLEEQFMQSQKMEAIGQLAGGVAHDFNNMLAVILSYSRIMFDELKEGDPMREDLSEVIGAAERSAGLTRQLLAFSRKQVLEPKILDLNATIKDLEKMLRRIIGEDIDLLNVSDSDLGLVKADPGQVEQVIINLVVNARDAMPKGGKLTVETANVCLNDLYASGHLSVKPGDYVMISVSDTGEGMDEETKSKIFDPFFTTKEIGKGTGLGLSTVYGIVNQSNGHVEVYSEPGHGTTFKVYLPRVFEEAPAADFKIKKQRSKGTETVLLVEDEVSVRKATCRILENAGYKVWEASSADDAFQVLDLYKDAIHLVLTDVIMPGTSGPDMADRILSMRPDVKILYMSGYTDSAVVNHGFLGASASFISKPFNPDSLLGKIRDILD